MTERHDQEAYARLMATTSKSVKRKSTDRDAAFVHAYYHLGLQKRWGPLDPGKEAEYTARSEQ